MYGIKKILNMYGSFYGYIIDTKNSDKKIDGVRLEISESNVIIEIPQQKLGNMRFEILNGYFSNYGDVTIIDANFYSSAGFLSAYGVIKYKVKYLLKGINLKTLDDIRFSKAYIELPSLSDFYANTLINQSHHENKLLLTIKEPEDIKLVDIDNYSLSISIGNCIQQKPNSVKIDETFKLRITSTEKDISLLDFFSLISRFQDFMLLILNYSSNIESITFYKNDYFYNNRDERTQIPIELIANFYNIEYEKNLHYNAIKYTSVNDTLGDMLSHWYKNTDLHVSIDLITEKMHNRELSRESYFLNSCFAIEIFHRRLYNGSEYSNETFSEILKGIYESIENQKVLSFIKNKLQFANEPSFRKRLKFFEDDLLKILPDSVDVGGFISKVIDTRNYLVHRSTNKKTFEGSNLFIVSKYIESALRIHFLKIIDCPACIIEESYSFAKDNLSKLYTLNMHL